MRSGLLEMRSVQASIEEQPEDSKPKGLTIVKLAILFFEVLIRSRILGNSYE